MFRTNMSEIVEEQMPVTAQGQSVTMEMTELTELQRQSTPPDSNAARVSDISFITKSKPYVLAILLQVIIVVNILIAKLSLDKGMSPHVFVSYKFWISAISMAPFAYYFEWRHGGSSTTSGQRVVEEGISSTSAIPSHSGEEDKTLKQVIWKIVLLGLLGAVVEQNLYYTGMEFTTATTVAAIDNLLPCATFACGILFKLEKIEFAVTSLFRVLGTIVSLGGALIVTVFQGPIFSFTYKTIGRHHPVIITHQHARPTLGALLVLGSVICSACFINLQKKIGMSYSKKLTSTTLSNLIGAVGASIVAALIERKGSVWSIRLDLSLLAFLYSGIVVCGYGFYSQAVIAKYKSPVFVSSFQPLSMLAVAFISAAYFSDYFTLSSVIGAPTIVVGLILYIWGELNKNDQS